MGVHTNSFLPLIGGEISSMLLKHESTGSRGDATGLFARESSSIALILAAKGRKEPPWPRDFWSLSRQGRCRWQISPSHRHLCCGFLWGRKIGWRSRLRGAGGAGATFSSVHISHTDARILQSQGLCNYHNIIRVGGTGGPSHDDIVRR
jgi:hypothetical protein